MGKFFIDLYAVVRSELFQHRETILEKLKKLPGCAHLKGIRLRAE